MTDTATQILDIAERQMRQHGYNAVSYRDIAAEMGIKSASLHYHFPKKADLGISLVKRYAENFYTALEMETQNLNAPRDKIKVFIDLHRRAFMEQDLICLCAVLGAEAQSLPSSVTENVRNFFQTNINWLSSVYIDAGITNFQKHAKASVAALEGAMIVASVNNDHAIFEATAELIRV